MEIFPADRAACGDASDVRRATLLSWALQVAVPIGFLCALSQLLLKPDFLGSFLIISVALGLGVVAWLINRAGRFREAAMLTAVVPSLFSFLSLWHDPTEFMAFAYPLLTVVLSGVLLSKRCTIALAGMNVLGLLALPLVHPLITFAMVSSPTGFNLIVPVLVLGIQTMRDAEEVEKRASIKQSEERYRALVQHAPESICVIELERQRFVDCNSHSERLFGLSAEELYRTGPGALSPLNQPGGTDSKEAWIRFAADAAKGNVVEFEWTHLHSSGREVSCEVRLARFPSDGRVLVRASITDISDRVRAERALRSSEERYRTLVETMNDGLVTLDLDLVISFVNGRLSEMWGYPPEHLVGWPLSDLVPRGEREVLDLEAQGPGGALRRDPYELVIRHGAGGTILIRVSPSPIFDAAGEVVGSLGVITEITKQKQAERALLESEAHFRSLIENASDIITVVDRDGKILFESPSLERILGHKPEAIVGRNVREFVHPEDAHHVFGALALGVRFPGVTRRLEFRLLHADGSWRLMEALGQGLTDRLGAGHVVVNSRDLTERRNLEREILEVSGREQRRLGQDLHDGMGQILVGARLYATALGRRLRGHEAAEDLAEIGRMLDEAHAAARALSRGLSPVSLEDGGLEAGLRDLAGSTQRMHGVSCVVECRKPVPIHDLEVATHVYRIAQEAVNNATKHGHSSKLRMRLAQAGGVASLTVDDNGVGFEEADLMRSGMGLSIMRYRARMISGSIEISPGKGGGTRVHCQFPIEGVSFPRMDWSPANQEESGTKTRRGAPTAHLEERAE